MDAEKVYQLQAGVISLRYSKGDIRYLRVGNTEILRRVYAAVRDARWNTIKPVITKQVVKSTSDSFNISFTVSCTSPSDNVDFVWQGEITGSSNSVITFSFNGTAGSAFLRQRIGFCILHGPQSAGSPCRIEQVDGTVVHAKFPTFVSPHQPFKNMAAIETSVDRSTCRVEFSGDVFEMEDQRNWTDASFKTYCTPLELPRPVKLEKGSNVQQSVVVKLLDQPSLSLGGKLNASFPTIGFGLSQATENLDVILHTEKEIALLKKLAPHHLRIDLRLFASDFADRLASAKSQAKAIGTLLEMAIFVTDEYVKELDALAGMLSDTKSVICWALIYHAKKSVTPLSCVKYAKERLAGVLCGSGTNNFFTELNRGKPDLRLSDFGCFSLNPQVHAFEDIDLVETLPMQAVCVQSAKHMYPQKDISVSPITLKKRFNPWGAEKRDPKDLPVTVDPRQSSTFVGCWTIGSLKHILPTVRSVTYFETAGWRGLLERETGSPLPDKFNSKPGQPFPCYIVFRVLREFKGGNLLAVVPRDELSIDGFAVCKHDTTVVFVANFTNVDQNVSVHGVPETARIKNVSKSNADAACRDVEAFLNLPGDACKNGKFSLPSHSFSWLKFTNK